MTHYFITGSNKGIGNALAHLLLKDKNNVVTGISRKNTITHPNYNFNGLDLNNLGLVQKFHFQVNTNAKKIVLINNAGTIGEIMPIGKINNSAIQEVFNINSIAPIILINNLLKQQLTIPITIVNISSGAAQSPIASWASYCASKAAIDMFALTLNEEFKTKNHQNKILNIAPGVVDTDMQVTIRKSSITDFSAVDKFRTLKNENQLKTPQEVAEMTVDLLTKSIKKPEVIYSLRNHPNY